ncbi:hypothetical protein HD554DRAFT_794719 [Boletus coccyginus]|nr:hypothetical protein HD554DRAFT_794719 [Boletus coccyginus]
MNDRRIGSFSCSNGSPTISPSHHSVAVPGACAFHVRLNQNRSHPGGTRGLTAWSMTHKPDRPQGNIDASLPGADHSQSTETKRFVDLYQQCWDRCGDAVQILTRLINNTPELRYSPPQERGHRMTMSDLSVMESEGKSTEARVISGWMPRSFSCPPRRDHSQRTYLARRTPSQRRVMIIGIDVASLDASHLWGTSSRTLIRCNR